MVIVPYVADDDGRFCGIPFPRFGAGVVVTGFRGRIHPRGENSVPRRAARRLGGASCPSEENSCEDHKSKERRKEWESVSHTCGNECFRILGHSASEDTYEPRPLTGDYAGVLKIGADIGNACFQSLLRSFRRTGRGRLYCLPDEGITRFIANVSGNRQECVPRQVLPALRRSDLWNRCGNRDLPLDRGA